MSSFGETKTKRFLAEKGAEFVKYNTRQISRSDQSFRIYLRFERDHDVYCFITEFIPELRDKTLQI